MNQIKITFTVFEAKILSNLLSGVAVLLENINSDTARAIVKDLKEKIDAELLKQ